LMSTMMTPINIAHPDLFKGTGTIIPFTHLISATHATYLPWRTFFPANKQSTPGTFPSHENNAGISLEATGVVLVILTNFVPMTVTTIFAAPSNSVKKI
jgi:hypothetical protein